MTSGSDAARGRAGVGAAGVGAARPGAAESSGAGPGSPELPPALAPAELIDAADVFSLLGDPARLRILLALRTGTLRVRDIAEAAETSESAASHALRLLRAHRIVTVERRGREAHYALADSHVRALLELMLDHVGHSTPLHDLDGHAPH